MEAPWRHHGGTMEAPYSALSAQKAEAEQLAAGSSWILHWMNSVCHTPSYPTTADTDMQQKAKCSAY